MKIWIKATIFWMKENIHHLAANEMEKIIIPRKVIDHTYLTDFSETLKSDCIFFFCYISQSPRQFVKGTKCGEIWIKIKIIYIHELLNLQYGCHFALAPVCYSD